MEKKMENDMETGLLCLTQRPNPQELTRQPVLTRPPTFNTGGAPAARERGGQTNIESYIGLAAKNGTLVHKADLLNPKA